MRQRVEEEGDDSGVKYKLRHFTKFRVLILVTALLALLSLIFIILYAVEKSKVNKPSTPQNPNFQTYCGTKDCLYTSLDVLKQLNQSADPCTDFYEYACGGWEVENALKPGETEVTGFSLVVGRTYDVLKAELENANKRYSDNEAVMKTVKSYDACVDKVAVEAEGDSPLKKLIDDLGGWNVMGKMTPLSSMSVTQRIGKVASELFIKPFIGIHVFIDPHDSNKHILQFGSGSLGMPRDYYMRNTSEHQKVREAYKTYMKRIAKLLGGGPDCDEKMMKVFEFETQLPTLPENDQENFIIETLKKQFPPGIAIRDIRSTLQDLSKTSKVDLNELVTLVNAVFAKQGRRFNKEDKVLAYPPNFYSRLFSFYHNITKTDPDVVVDYIMWTVIRNFIPVMPKRYLDAYNDYLVTFRGDVTRHRWMECICRMQSVFKMPLGLLYVNAAFEEKSKQTVTQMTQLMKDEFIKNVDKLSWMSDLTKANAREKAVAIAEDIGYPSYIKDPAKLSAKLKGLKVGNKLFENTISTMAFSANESYGSLDKPVDRKEWFMGPSQVNGYYSPKQNRIVFLAAILQPPFYNPKYPRYLNFGGIGMVIGHEITHGFDDNGRYYDKDGNWNNWWSPRSLRGFVTRANCLAKQYSQFDVYGKKRSVSFRRYKML